MAKDKPEADAKEEEVIPQTEAEKKNQEAVAPTVVEGRRDGNGALIV